jgi:DHA1 family multidrug resistance protein-like MFS transporter
LSESFGRQPVYLVTLLVSSVFTIGTGASRTWAQVLVTRFFSGAFGGEPQRTHKPACSSTDARLVPAAAVLAVAGGSLNDIYNHVERGYAFPIYAGAGFMGPMAAPVVGTAISQFWDWRWNYYLCGIAGCVLALFTSAFCPETLGEIVLFEKARCLWARSKRESFAGPAIREPRRKKTPLGKFLQ